MHSKPHTVVIVQTRMGSSRLPGKALKEVLGKPLLSFLLERLKRCSLADLIVVATTNKPRDRQIVDLCRKEGIPCFIGPEDHVLERYYQTALHYGAEVIVRITGDNPLADPGLIDEMLKTFFDHYPNCDYLSNVIERTYPRGLDVEIFTMKCLEKIMHYAAKPEEQEHVTTYVLHHPDRFAMHSFKQPLDLSHWRWTVDTNEDYIFIRRVLETLYPKNPCFGMQDVIQWLKEHPEWERLEDNQ